MKTNEELLQMYAAEIYKVFGAQDMVDYCVKKVPSIIEMPEGGLFVFEKPKIKTHFCFGEDGGESYNQACNMAYNVARTERYFMNANLRDIDAKIADLKGRYAGGGEYIRAKYKVYDKSDLIWGYLIAPRSWREQVRDYLSDPLTDADTKALIALFKSERAKFEKRLKAYWKRYGASKLKTWTYWENA